MELSDKKNWYREFKEWLKPEEFLAVQDKEVGGHLFRGLIKFGNNPLVLNGEGIRYLNDKPLYAVGLYLPAFTQRADTAKALIGARRTEIVILQPLNAGEFIDSLHQGILNNVNETAREFIREELLQLDKVMDELVDMIPGDQVDFDWIPNKGTFITYNEEVLGNPIRGKALYDAVLSIWLGQNPLDEQLKKELLTGKPN